MWLWFSVVSSPRVRVPARENWLSAALYGQTSTSRAFERLVVWLLVS